MIDSACHHACLYCVDVLFTMMPQPETPSFPLVPAPSLSLPPVSLHSFKPGPPPGGTWGLLQHLALHIVPPPAPPMLEFSPKLLFSFDAPGRRWGLLRGPCCAHCMTCMRQQRARPSSHGSMTGGDLTSAMLDVVPNMAWSFHLTAVGCMARVHFSHKAC